MNITILFYGRSANFRLFLPQIDEFSNIFLRPVDEFRMFLSSSWQFSWYFPSTDWQISVFFLRQVDKFCDFFSLFTDFAWFFFQRLIDKLQCFSFNISINFVIFFATDNFRDFFRDWLTNFTIFYPSNDWQNPQFFLMIYIFCDFLPVTEKVNN